MASVFASSAIPIGIVPGQHRMAQAPVIRVLVVTPQLELRKFLLQILQDLSFDVVACSNLTQALDVLSSQGFDLIFCDDRLGKGSYSNLISRKGAEPTATLIVVTTQTDDWDFYIEALRGGAFDIIRYPCVPTDIELMIIRAVRERSCVSLQQLAG